MGVTAYTRSKSFTSHSTNYPDDPQSGVDLDVEFNAVKISIGSLITELAKIQRADSALANSSVHSQSLNTAVRALMLAEWEPRGTWAASTDYALKDVVQYNGGTFMCSEAHTSDDFDADLAVVKWLTIAPQTVSGGTGVVAAGDVSFESGGGYVSTNVQAALFEVYTAKQAAHANLTAFSAVTGGADKLAYFTSASAMAAADLTAFARTLLDDSDAATARSTLGLGTAATKATGTTSGTVPVIGAGNKLDSSIIPTVSGEIPVGAILPYFSNAAPAGWYLCDATTIGSATSGATHADDENETLFTLIWNKGLDADNPVTGGRGASAAADWAANKKIALPDCRGVVLIGLDNLGGSAASRITSSSTNGGNSTQVGAHGGSQTHTLTTGEMPSHTHTEEGAESGTGGTPEFTPAPGGGGRFASQNTGSAGGGGAHSNTQPWMAVGMIIKY